jgi:ABC-2 type transport system ATP-binding protein
MLCGLIDATGGHASVAGFDVSREVDAVKDNIGYMAQRFGLYGDLTVEENMEFYGDLFGLALADRHALTERLLSMTRMEPFRGRRAAQLSGGMKQKLALMCTLLHRPRILFLDEPTNGVDPVSRRDFWIILYQLVKEGMTVLVTTAYLDEAERCDRVGLLHKGRLIRCDSPGDLKRGLEETCYEVRCQNPRPVREVLQTCEGVLTVEPFGPALHLFLSSVKTNVETLQTTLQQHRLMSVLFKQIEPSLEDVFIALVRKAD